MLRTSHFLAALATVCLLAVAIPSTPASQPPAEEPMSCPYCGGRFSYESFLAETGTRITLRTVRLYTGG